MKYLSAKGMKEALLRNANQIWLHIKEKLATKPTDEADLPSEGWKNEIPAYGRHEILPSGSMKYPFGR